MKIFFKKTNMWVKWIDYKEKYELLLSKMDEALDSNFDSEKISNAKTVLNVFKTDLLELLDLPKEIQTKIISAKKNIDLLEKWFTPSWCDKVIFNTTLWKMEHEWWMSWILSVMKKKWNNEWQADLKHFKAWNNHQELQERWLVDIKDSIVSFTEEWKQLIWFQYLIWKDEVEKEINSLNKLWYQDFIKYDTIKSDSTELKVNINKNIKITLEKVLEKWRSFGANELVDIFDENKSDHIWFVYRNSDSWLEKFLKNYIPVKYAHIICDEENRELISDLKW